MLMSHLADTIANADVSTQILYNRALVQLGLCAFRSGMITEAQFCLQEFLNTGRLKELLAQGPGSARYNEKTREQEKMERQLELPFHMHINVELIECVYLTSSMLIEIPGLASVVQEDRKRMKSKPFRRLLEINERQIFQGPPENTREHVLAASRALAAGDWKKCKDLITGIKIWELMPDSTKIKEMLQRFVALAVFLPFGEEFLCFSHESE
jgi:translation initiation factor 3 subunit C